MLLPNWIRKASKLFNVYRLGVLSKSVTSLSHSGEVCHISEENLSHICHTLGSLSTLAMLEPQRSVCWWVCWNVDEVWSGKYSQMWEKIPVACPMVMRVVRLLFMMCRQASPLWSTVSGWCIMSSKIMSWSERRQLSGYLKALLGWSHLLSPSLCS